MVIILMGVSGSGKSTVGRQLARMLDGVFQDGDWFHPTANIAKMRAGRPLTDEDRELWLDSLSQAIDRWLVRDCPYILACSALKQEYRQRLQWGNPRVQFIYLKGSPALIEHRLAGRENHFMPPSLLASQLATIEEPQGIPAIEIDQTPDAIAAEIIRKLT